MYRLALFATLLTATAALPIDAQGRGQNQSRTQQGWDSAIVPPAQWPEPGTCRIWLTGVPVTRQPLPTDCETARRRVPSNGRVLDGNIRRDDRFERDDDRWDDDDHDNGRYRRYIDQNGLECREKLPNRPGDRSYEIKCKEPKRNNGRGNVPARGQQNGQTCVDVNRDGRCDPIRGGTQYPVTLPDMLGAVLFGQGRRTDDVSRWLGAGRYQVRYVDQNRDRRPERATWMDAAGTLLQVWVDTNRDGRADAVNLYEGGRIVRTIGGR
jgi:hypothetical protein